MLPPTPGFFPLTRGLGYCPEVWSSLPGPYCLQALVGVLPHFAPQNCQSQCKAGSGIITLIPNWCYLGPGTGWKWIRPHGRALPL